MATLANLMRFASSGGYDPTQKATTLSDALAPTGINDAYGNPYVGSRWTRFTNPQDVAAFDTSRNQAFTDWANQAGQRLGNRGSVQVRSMGQTSGVPGLEALFTIGGTPQSVTMGDYDQWTKTGQDPLEMLRQRLTPTGYATGAVNPLTPKAEIKPTVTVPAKTTTPVNRGAFPSDPGPQYKMSSLLTAAMSPRDQAHARWKASRTKRSTPQI